MKRVKERGYITLWMPDHPMARRNGYLAEHRLVASQKLGRYLSPQEHVHHVNEDRSDNRPENLEVLSAREHALHHHPERQSVTCACGEATKNRMSCSSRCRTVRRRFFSDEDLIRNVGLGLNNVEIAAALDVSETAIRKRRKLLASSLMVKRAPLEGDTGGSIPSSPANLT